MVVVLVSKADIWLECFKYNPDIRPILVWPLLLAQVLPHPQLIFPFQNLVFWNLFEFAVADITLKSISPHSESKSYPKNSIKSCSSRSFQQHQRHIAIPPKFSATI
jgi:hypothetical protein